MIPLGPFDLHTRLGRGGMCEVWQGVHRGQQFPVAIKVISKELARQPRYLRGFREEVRSVAGLSHPAIVMVFDYGQITEEAHALSEGLLPAESPYLVMELGKGSMQSLCGKLHWPQLYPILISVLDALAHAHARGVIHRDLKPENILFFEDHRAKLADFGLAYLWSHGEQDAEAKELSGTPAFMAPEQFELRWRDLGPWTDLYALGCTTYALLTGHAPFRGNMVQALMFAHLSEAPPALHQDVHVPDGFQEWLFRMLAKDPAQRFQRAADAAHALRLLEPDGPQIDDETITLHASDLVGFDYLEADWDDEEQTSPRAQASILIEEHLDDLDPASPTLNGISPWLQQDPPNPIELASPTPGWDDEPTAFAQKPPVVAPAPPRQAEEHVPNDRTQIIRSPKPRAKAPDDAPPTKAPLPPLPAIWDTSQREARSIALTEVGLGLYGMRAIPLLGRDHEQRSLWSTLQQVATEGKARMVALVGPAGCGKSRLARSMSEYVHEVGAAIPFKAVHTRLPGPAAGLGAMLSRHLRCVGLDHKQITDRLTDLTESDWSIDASDLHPLTELMAPTGSQHEAGQTVIRFSLPTERYTVVERYLTRLTQQRPVLLWLDDVQWGLDSLQFAKHILERQQVAPIPLLILATVREDALLERDVEAHCLQELLHEPLAHELQVGPLAAQAHAQLIRELLHLQGELAYEVEERTAGNPLFAVQLVGDWVQRGALECGARGFRLRKGYQLDLPDNLHEVWTKRIHQALESKTSDALRALEIAATLGLEVNTREWLDACQHANIQPTADLLEILLEQRLAMCEDGNIDNGWAFVHSMLRESLERWAKEAERWEGHNLACALMLQARKGPGFLERRGRHLLHAGLLRDAVEPLRQGIWERLEAHELFQARQMLDEWLGLLKELHWPASHPNWGEAWLLEASYARETGFYEVAKQWAARAVEDARLHQWDRIIPRALMWFGYYDWRSGGNPDECWQYMQEAEERARHQNDHETLQHCYRQTGDFLASRGLLEQATKYFQHALRESDAQRNPTAMGRACHGMAMVERQAGQHEASWEWSERAMAYFEAGGHRRGVADSLNVFGDLSRLVGDLEDAEQYYRKGLEISYALGTGNEALFELNLGLVLTERQEYTQARQILEKALASMAWRKRALFEGAAHICLLPCLAHQQDWRAWHKHIAKAITLLSGSGFYDVDLAQAATRAGQIAQEIGANSRAKEAYELALEQWDNLERTEEVAHIKESLLQLTTTKQSQ